MPGQIELSIGQLRKHEKFMIFFFFEFSDVYFNLR